MKERFNITITFDGGTPCNNPRLGYGDGYGSYQLAMPDGRCTLQRVSFMRPMSANAAEIFTLIKAVQEVLSRGYRRELTTLRIVGDSQIALKWAAGKNRFGRPAKISENTSQEFRNAIQSLRDILAGFECVETTWQPRHKSVAIFGH